MVVDGQPSEEEEVQSAGATPAAMRMLMSSVGSSVERHDAEPTDAAVPTAMTRESFAMLMMNTPVVGSSRAKTVVARGRDGKRRKDGEQAERLKTRPASARAVPTRQLMD